MRAPLPLLATALAAATLALPATASARGVVPPSNDDVSNAYYLDAGDSTTGTTVGATSAQSDPEDVQGDRTVWYFYTAYADTPVEVSTDVSSPDPALSAHITVYSGTPGDLEVVAKGDRGDPSLPSTHEEARFPVEQGDDYYIAVSNSSGGSRFDVSVEHALKPSTLQIAGQVFGDGRPQIYVEKGRHPRIRVSVVTGFPGARKPGRGVVVLRAEGRRYRATLRGGEAVLVLPRIKNSYEVVARYSGTRTIDPAQDDAYVNVT